MTSRCELTRRDALRGHDRLFPKLFESPDCVRRVHQGRPAAHIDGHAEHFLDLLACGTEFDEGLGVKSGAAVAMRGHAECQRDQSLGLPVERPVPSGGLCSWDPPWLGLEGTSLQPERFP